MNRIRSQSVLGVIFSLVVLASATFAFAQTNDLDPNIGAPSVSDVLLATPIVANAQRTPALPDIQNVVEPPFALPGDEVTFSIIIHNPNAFAVADLTAQNDVPPSLEILDASSDSGIVSVDGQIVSFAQDVMTPNESTTLTVQTRIRDSIAPPFILINQVCGQYANTSQTCVQASVLSVSALPNTGETPYWRTPLLLMLTTFAVVSLIASAFLLARHLRAFHL